LSCIARPLGRKTMRQTTIDHICKSNCSSIEGHTHQLGGLWRSHNEVANCVTEKKKVDNKGQIK
jgi:hypothetical protein